MTAAGQDRDDRSNSGAAEEETRQARAGETDTRRFGLADDGSQTGGARTGGGLAKEEPGAAAAAGSLQGRGTGENKGANPDRDNRTGSPKAATAGRH